MTFKRRVVVSTISAIAVTTIVDCAVASEASDIAPAPVHCALEGQGSPSVPDSVSDQVIHDYLTRHPEVLIEMSQALRERQQAEASAKARQAIGANQAALTGNAADPVAGNPAGEVTIVEFFDVECPFCKKLAPDLARLGAE
ncbi:MAG: thioredoxin domain-containing protein, partial [Methanobacterium sp.]|nr:thioredoxin domain-containing protein [Methanobacterium sp.]